MSKMLYKRKFLSYTQVFLCVLNQWCIKIKMCTSIIETNNNFNECFNIQLNKRCNQIEGKYDDFYR
jgi:hypothetical protein